MTARSFIGETGRSPPALLPLLYTSLTANTVGGRDSRRVAGVFFLRFVSLLEFPETFRTLRTFFGFSSSSSERE